MSLTKLSRSTLVLPALLVCVFLYAGCEDSNTSGPPAFTVGLQIQPENPPTMISGLTYPFTATLTKSDGTTQDVTDQCQWSTMPYNMGYMSNYPVPGNFRASGSGLGYLTARYYQGYEGTEQYEDTIVIMMGNLNELIIDPAEASVAAGNSLALSCKAVITLGSNWTDTVNFDNNAIWISDDPAIAEVNNQGVVTGKAAGQTQVHAGWGFFTDFAEVQVTP